MAERWVASRMQYYWVDSRLLGETISTVGFWETLRWPLEQCNSFAQARTYENGASI